MKRGDIYFADLNSTIGSETQKIRPVIIISNNANNKFAPILTVIPITSNTKKIYPFEVLLEMQESGLPKQSKAQCHQIRTISKLRIKGKQAGHIENMGMLKIEQAIKIHLAFK